MATSTATADRTYVNPYRSLGGGAVAGVVAGLAFGLLIQFVLGRMTAIGAMYTLGDPSVTIGWVAHVAHSAAFGGLYGLLALSDRVRAYTGILQTGVLAGAAYGVALWFVNIGFLWPLWLNYVGFGSGLPIPFFAPAPLLGHLVYGVGLGALFALVSE